MRCWLCGVSLIVFCLILAWLPARELYHALSVTNCRHDRNWMEHSVYQSKQDLVWFRCWTFEGSRMVIARLNFFSAGLNENIVMFEIKEINSICWMRVSNWVRTRKNGISTFQKLISLMRHLLVDAFLHGVLCLLVIVIEMFFVLIHSFFVKRELLLLIYKFLQIYDQGFFLDVFDPY